MHQPLVIACVKWGVQYGAYFVNMLHEMVQRHLPKDTDYTFQCFTDNPEGLRPEIVARALPGDLTGWWNKLHLFKEGVFAPEARLLYFDLDTLILGPLEALINYQGDFAILRDFYRPAGYGSGVMAWRGAAGYSIWSSFEAAGKPVLPGGDQVWIETAYKGVDLLQEWLPGVFASYKTECHPLPPAGTSIVCFHGEPKQDNCDAPWVRNIWKPGGSHVIADAAYATRNEESLAHAQLAMTQPYRWLKRKPAHERCAVIIGTGPSLEECREELLADRARGYDFFAINRAASWLAANVIAFDAQVICAPEAEQALFITSADVPCYCASVSHPAALIKAAERAVLWHPQMPGLPESAETVKGGSTTGLQAIALAHLLGYRNFQLYGFDSCCNHGKHHACTPPEAERDRVLARMLNGREFHATNWMLRQAEEFVPLAATLIEQGCSITIHGDGLLHYLAVQVAQGN